MEPLLPEDTAKGKTSVLQVNKKSYAFYETSRIHEYILICCRLGPVGSCIKHMGVRVFGSQLVNDYTCIHQ